MHIYYLQIGLIIMYVKNISVLYYLEVLSTILKLYNFKIEV